MESSLLMSLLTGGEEERSRVLFARLIWRRLMTRWIGGFFSGFFLKKALEKGGSVGLWVV